MLKKILTILLLLFVSAPIAAAATTANQTLSATKSGGGGGTGGGGGISSGAIVGIAGGGTAASGATALAFAPLLLAGLEPNAVICAAAPIEGIQKPECFLQAAIVNHFGSAQEIIEAMKTMQNGIKKYYAQNDCEIINGTYDIDDIKLSDELKKANKLKINITIVSQPYGITNGEPDFQLELFKDISRPNISKKFETQQFLHNYLMKKYNIPLKTTSLQNNNGIQKLSGVLDISKMEYPNQPLQTVVRYTKGGFRRNLKAQNPSTLTYAYLIEFEKIH